MDVLGVAKTADTKEIKSAFRKLARQYHPDVSQEPDAEDKFKEINEAYEVLSNDEKRARYDRFGHARGQVAQVPVDMVRVVLLASALRIFLTSSIAHLVVQPQVQPVVATPVQVVIVVLMSRLILKNRSLASKKRLSSNASKPVRYVTAMVRKKVQHPQPALPVTVQVKSARYKQTFLGSMVRVTTCPNCGGKGNDYLQPMQQLRWVRT